MTISARLEQMPDYDVGDPDDALLQPRDIYAPERALWYAVLEQAFYDTSGQRQSDHRYAPRAAMVRADALLWFASDDDSQGTLRWIVRETGLNTTVEAIRGRVR